MDPIPVLGFALTLSCVAAMLAIFGWQLVLGFTIGVIVTLIAGTLAAADLE